MLINLENTADNGFEFDDAEKFPERLLLKGRAQQTVQEIVEACGWKDDLVGRKAKADAKHDDERKGRGLPIEQVEDLTKRIEGLEVGKGESAEKKK